MQELESIAGIASSLIAREANLLPLHEDAITADAANEKEFLTMHIGDNNTTTTKFKDLWAWSPERIV